ncbi:MAG: hypothetical protein HOM58_18210 [Rhodospirillaceae bacterium]|nr:hypothetical protein [Rhodospirillaceae bacterium]
MALPSMAVAADSQMVKRLKVMKKCELCNLSGADLSGMSLARANLAGANLRGANLEGTDLSRANLRGAKLDGATLKDATLTSADLRGAHLNGALLTGANLKWTRLERAWIRKADLRGAKIQGTRFTGATLEGADLRDTNLKKTNLAKVILRGVNFSGADLEGHRFGGLNLSGANLTNANLQRANFTKAILIGANLAGANLSKASLDNADARNAKFASADLTGASLRRADLSGADFTGATLRSANLGGAELVGAKLVKADLSKANLQDSKMTGAISIGAQFIESNLRNSSLLSADLSRADFSNAAMGNANLGAANLHEASLEGANLTGADLRFADLRASKTGGTRFAGADLRGAKVTKEDLLYAELVEAKLDRDLMAALNIEPKKKPAADDSAATAAVPSQKTDLIPEKIEKTKLSVALVDIVTIPPSSDEIPHARLNWLYHAGDGSGRLFVVDMRGKIHVIRNGRVLPTPFLDIGAIRSKYLYHRHFETGLSIFAFHPDFTRRGRPGYGKFYTVHTERGSAPKGSPLPRKFASPIEQIIHVDVLIEWTVDRNNPDRINPASLREVLRVEQPHKSHNIAMLAFNPTARPGTADYGMLYIGSGDGGDTIYSGFVDAQRVAQDRTRPFGSILRIDPLADGDMPYTVPQDNPFVGKPGHLAEIWAYGFRHPIRFSWDSGGTGKMIIADVGQVSVEELNLGVPGANYGWSEREGTFVVDHEDQTNVTRLPSDDSKNRYAYPVAQYDNGEGTAITGGFVYRGKKNPDLQGLYIFGDYDTGRIFYVPVKNLIFGRQAKISELTLHYKGQPKTLLEIMGGENRADLRFGMGEDGEIYVLTKRDGMVRTFQPITGLQSNR